MNYQRWVVFVVGAWVCLGLCGAALGATNLALSATATGEVAPNALYPPSNANDGDFGTLYWQGSASFSPNSLWFQLTWDTAQQFNVVVAYFLSHDWFHGRTVLLQRETAPDVWEDIASCVVVTEGNPAFDVARFRLPTKLSVDKIRVVNLIDLFEVEVYDAADVVMSGHITTGGWVPVGNATITAGTASKRSACADGAYELIVPPGEVEVKVSAPGYTELVQTVAVPEEGLTKDFDLSPDTQGLASTATVTASSFLETPFESFPPASAADRDSCNYWEAAGLLDHGSEWLQFDWESPVTIDTVKIVDGGAASPVTVEVWKDEAWLLVAMDEAPEFPLALQFAPVETTKLRINRLWKAYEVEIRNDLGPVQAPNVTGTVTNSLTGQPVVQARVTVGDVSCYTSAAGTYGFFLPEGSATITVSKTCYDDASAEVHVPASGTITRDFVLVTENIAPLASSVTASLQVEGAPGSNCADDRIDTSWQAGAVVWGTYIELQWAEAVTLNEVKLHKASGGGQSLYLQVDYWNGSEWRYAGNRAVTLAEWAGVVALQFYPITTTKIRVSGAFVIAELEVDQCAPPNPVVEPISELRSLPDGTLVKVSGSVTAGFEDIGAAYVETLDRVSAIKCKPWSAFPSTSGPNIARSATATASIVPLEQYGPSNANDGDTGTEYYPGNTAVFTNPNAEWLQLTWAEPQTFNSVTVYLVQHAVSRGRVCKLQRYNSETGSWEDFASASGTNDTSTPFVYVIFNLDTPVTLDQVRFTNPTDLFEMEVFLKGGDSVNHEVTVEGMLATEPNGQRYISVGPIAMGSENALRPLGMTNKALNGTAGGINTSSLLVNVSGTVIAAMRAGASQYVYIDDGSGVQGGPLATPGVRVGPFSSSLAKEGDYISAAGIVQYASSPVAIRPRSDGDIVVQQVGPTQVNIAPLATATAESVPNPAYGPENANDGNLATEYWAGYGVYSPNTLWLQYTWDSPQTIRRVVAYYMNHDYMHGRTVTLQREVAPDVWEDVAGVVVVTAGAYDVALFALPSPLTTDKIRVVNMFDLWEVEVY